MTLMNFTSDKMPSRMPRIIQIPKHNKSMNINNSDLSKLKDNRFAHNGGKINNSRNTSGSRSLQVKLVKPVKF
jgi:ribosomal protein S18